MNRHRANRIQATIERKGFRAFIEKDLEGYKVIAFGKEGQERDKERCPVLAVVLLLASLPDHPRAGAPGDDYRDFQMKRRR